MTTPNLNSPLCNPWGWAAKLSKMGTARRSVAILGSTGSIGRSALDIVRNNPERFKVKALSCGGSDPKAIAEQITEFNPELVSIENSSTAQLIRREFPEVKLQEGRAGAVQVAESSEIVVAAISGVSGLASTIAALRNDAIVALANKESIVCGVDLLRNIKSGTLIPVDSEHSSLAQLLLGVTDCAHIESLTLTASGGPFLERDLTTFKSITPQQAIKHPRWNMGAKISIDSSTLVNKALEWFEAVFLFGVPRIEIVIHPQSIVHACVSLKDGAILANLSHPDMKLPISFAMGIGERISGTIKPLNLGQIGQLTFRELDENRFPSIPLAREALKSGSFGTCVYSLANEIAVERFCGGAIKYTEIVPFIAKTLSSIASRPIDSVESIESLLNDVRSIK